MDLKALFKCANSIYISSNPCLTLLDAVTQQLIYLMKIVIAFQQLKVIVDGGIVSPDCRPCLNSSWRIGQYPIARFLNQRKE